MIAAVGKNLQRQRGPWFKLAVNLENTISGLCAAPEHLGHVVHDSLRIHEVVCAGKINRQVR